MSPLDIAKAALSAVYVRLIQQPVNRSVFLQTELCMLRDVIAQLDGKDAEEVQNTHEAIAKEMASAQVRP